MGSAAQLKKLKNKILNGHSATIGEAMFLAGLEEAGLGDLYESANEIRKFFCGDAFDMCSIINAKSGACTENCKFCSQSAHHGTGVEVHPLLEKKRLIEGALYNHNKGVLRFGIVTSGKRLNDAEIDALCEYYSDIGKACGIFRCASNGLLSYEQLARLKDAGLQRYHSNLETSRRFFNSVCTTHAYDEKIAVIKNAQRTGMDVCSGGIFGLGETMEDRIDMALELRELGLKSVPVNVLTPIAGTPLEGAPVLENDEVLRIVAIYRFILPDAIIRMAGGRALLKDYGKSAFLSGSNASISGDMLSTAGVNIDDDMRLVREIGYTVRLPE